MEVPPAPNLDGWLVWCHSCKAERLLNQFTSRDAGTGETYYEYVCQECDTQLLQIMRANPAERERQAPSATAS